MMMTNARLKLLWLCLLLLSSSFKCSSLNDNAFSNDVPFHPQETGTFTRVDLTYEDSSPCLGDFTCNVGAAYRNHHYHTNFVDLQQTFTSAVMDGSLQEYVVVLNAETENSPLGMELVYVDDMKDRILNNPAGYELLMNPLDEAQEDEEEQQQQGPPSSSSHTRRLSRRSLGSYNYTICNVPSSTAAEDSNHTDYFKCKLLSLQQSILHCSMFIFMEGSVMKYLNGSQLSHTVHAFDITTDNITEWLLNASNGATNTGTGTGTYSDPITNWMNYQTQIGGYGYEALWHFLKSGGGTYGITDYCMFDVIDDIVAEFLPAVPNLNETTLYGIDTSFVCVNSTVYTGDQASTYGGQTCTELTLSLLGLSTYSYGTAALNLENLTFDMCNYTLVSPVGQYFNDTIKVGDLVIKQGETCCGMYDHRNTNCDDWATTRGYPTDASSRTDGSDDDSDSDFSWSAYWKMYDHGEAYLIPLLIFILTGACACIISSRRERRLRQGRSNELMNAEYNHRELQQIVGTNNQNNYHPNGNVHDTFGHNRNDASVIAIEGNDSNNVVPITPLQNVSQV